MFVFEVAIFVAERRRQERARLLAVLVTRTPEAAPAGGAASDTDTHPRRSSVGRALTVGGSSPLVAGDRGARSNGSMTRQVRAPLRLSQETT